MTRDFELLTVLSCFDLASIGVSGCLLPNESSLIYVVDLIQRIASFLDDLLQVFDESRDSIFVGADLFSTHFAVDQILLLFETGYITSLSLERLRRRWQVERIDVEVNQISSAFTNHPARYCNTFEVLMIDPLYNLFVHQIVIRCPIKSANLNGKTLINKLKNYVNEITFDVGAPSLNAG